MRLRIAVTLTLLGCGPLPKQPTQDGTACETKDDCASNHCSGGFCAGADCGCGTLESCGTTPKTSSDCQSGWKCVGTPLSLFVTGICSLPCTSSCPASWTCQGDFCLYVPPEPTPPTVTIDSAPNELELGTAGTFTGSATSPNGPIASFAWQLGDGAQASGVSVMHAYTEAGLFMVTATAVDDAGISGSAMTTVRACLPLGADCYPFDSRGNCCTGQLCGVDGDGGTHCHT